MTLEGSLDAFSLPDIFQLLSFTKKSGALHIQSPSTAGVVFFATGSVTGGTSDTGRQALGRRVVGKGLVSDETLAAAVAMVREDAALGLARALRDSGAAEEGVLHEIAIEQATDAVFDLLRWSSGDFAFQSEEHNPDDLGISLAVEDVIAEGRRRLETWEALSRVVPAPDMVLSLPIATIAAETVVSAEEWTLLSLVDGHRSVADLVDLTGRGEFAIVSTVVSLVERGLVAVRAAEADDVEGVAALLRRQSQLAELEGRAPRRESAGSAAARRLAAEPAPAPAAEEPATVPERRAPDKPFQAPQRSAISTNAAHAPEPRSAAVAQGAVPQVVPTRPDSILARKPDFPEGPIPGVRQPSAGVPRTIGATAVAAATQPASVPSAGALIERDPSVNKSLLLRLIAGVRGL
jgi:hypothetical protein